MRSTCSLGIAGLFALSLTGCASKPKIDVSTAIIGKWSGKTKAPPEAQKMKPGLGEISYTVEFKPDKTFTMETLNLPLEGTWAPTGDLAVGMTFTKMMGQEVPKLMETLKPLMKAQGKEKEFEESIAQLSKPQPATLSEDGKSLSLTTPPSPGEKSGGIVSLEKSG